MKEKTILVVNSADTLRRITLHALMGLNCRRVVEAAGIEEAEEEIIKIDDDILVILELTISKYRTEELDLLQRLRQYSKLKNIGVIVTSLVRDEELNEYLSMIGLEEPLIKTFDMNLFSHELDQAIQMAESKFETNSI
ncbi:hypothetical protein ACFL5V_12355 [Fibrobacterota bacterium]